MPKDTGEKQNRLAELRRAWYERPKTETKTAQAEPTRRTTKTTAAPDGDEMNGDDAVATSDAKKGRRATSASKKKTSEATPLELAVSEQTSEE